MCMSGTTMTTIAGDACTSPSIPSTTQQVDGPNLPSGWPCPPWKGERPPSEMCVTGWTLPRPTTPRLHQALPQPGAPRHPEDPHKPAHCEHFSFETNLACEAPDTYLTVVDTCLTRARDSKVRSYPLCKSSETPHN